MPLKEETKKALIRQRVKGYFPHKLIIRSSNSFNNITLKCKKFKKLFIQIIDLSDSNIENKSIPYLITLLKEAPFLRMLDFSSNLINDFGLKLMTNALHRKRSLLSLNLSGSNISPSSMKYFATRLKQNNTLQRLDLSGCNLGGINIYYLSKALQKNMFLQILNLQGNKIDDEDLKWLALALQENSSLRSLDLSSNAITDDGLACLVPVFQNNTLQSLDLTENTITKKGAEKVATALEGNTSLRILAFGGGRIGGTGAKYFLDAFASNFTLTSLTFSESIGELVHCQIQSQLLRNHNIALFQHELKKDGEFTQSAKEKYCDQFMKNDSFSKISEPIRKALFEKIWEKVNKHLHHEKTTKKQLTFPLLTFFKHKNRVKELSNGEVMSKISL